MKRLVIFVGLMSCSWPVALISNAAPIEPLPFVVPAQMPDAAVALSPSAVQLQGFIGERIAVNTKNRLLKVDEAPLLAGFRKKPGSHPWIGEHVGKWMHAASLAWAHTGDPALRAKIDRMAAELIKTQEPDGYLGTYLPSERFGIYPGKDGNEWSGPAWDVWSHKYNMMGLLTYHQYSGNKPALEASRKMADLLIATLGPDKKSILSAGTHVGMAATSVLEPMVLLYRFTAEPRYLEFANYIVGAWTEPRGPNILHSLLTEKNVSKTANAKAYEMLSNLVGLCELARVTGNRDYLQAALNAWTDIVDYRLYVTGSASQAEHFRGDFELPNHQGANVAETCVTVTWIQLNEQLLRLTGQARFGDELEKTLCNHLAAAQKPDGSQWCYFTALEGTKPYGPGINCCVSSGPRGFALAPQQAYLKARSGDADVLLVNFFDGSRLVTQLDGTGVTIDHTSDFPKRGTSLLTVRAARPASFGLMIRSPAWAAPLRLQINGQPLQPEVLDGWASIPVRRWQDGDRVQISYNLSSRMILGEHGNAGRAALAWGPFVLAYDWDRNPGMPAPAALALAPADPPCVLSAGEGLVFNCQVSSARQPQPQKANFVPFANAGSDGGIYRVWLRAPGATWPANASLLSDGSESRSRFGNVNGSIIDGDTGTFVVTFNNRPSEQDWFAVTLDEPVKIRRVAFAHGRTFHDGGWFDISAGKPLVQVKATPKSQWKTVGELSDYPATTATDSGGLKSGQKFDCRLDAAVEAVAVRVIGKPASGSNPKQAFSSCGELEAFATGE
jgi:uncharacterized protein